MADVKRGGRKLLPSEIANLMAEAVGWRPGEGDEIDGVVLGVKVGTSTFGSYPIVFVIGKDDDEPVALHCFHTILKNEMVAQRPERGDTIYVKYLGFDPDWEGPKGYDSPRKYAVLVMKPGTAAGSVWDALPADRIDDVPKSGQFNDPPPFE